MRVAQGKCTLCTVGRTGPVHLATGVEVAYLIPSHMSTRLIDYPLADEINKWLQSWTLHITFNA